jgi:hypothetical protein
MARDWESWINNSTGPASGDEEARRDRTEQRIKDAIARDRDLNASVRVQAKGSYANNTNVRLDSDVDIAIEWRDQFKLSFFGEAIDKTAAELGYTTAEKVISPQELRARVERALVNALPTSSVDTSGNKAIRVGAGSGTLDADVVPCFWLRRYDGPNHYHDGQRLFSRNGGEIDNWPEQGKQNGNAKNNRTARRYKRMIRAIKRLENEMVEQRALASPVPGYLIECLVWNVPDPGFGHTRLLDDMQYILATAFNATMHDDDACHDWGEVNELKYLFRASQTWTREQAHRFAGAAWDYIGFD